MKVLETDVLICGGGCAGLAAALASARAGAKSLMIERAPFAGGIMTTVGLPFFDGIIHKNSQRVVVRGIAMELMVKSGMCEPGITHMTPHNPTFKSIERFKILADELLAAESNLDILYHTQAAAVERDGKRISRVIVANKDGLVAIRAKQVIDATGDGDIAYWSGAPTEQLKPLMPMTMHFRIGNVERAPNLNRDAADALKRAQDNGDLPMFYGPWLSFLFAEDEVYVHAVRVPGNAVNSGDLTRAEMQGRKDAFTMFEYWRKHVHAMRNAYYISSGPYIGVRETRRLQGSYVLNENDIMNARPFDDAIATGCWYLDCHPNETTVGGANSDRMLQPEPYDIPYRTLTSDDVPNLLVAGRCHSATAAAASSTRVTNTAMALGEAAGVAAAMAVGQGEDAVSIDGANVREQLAAVGGGPFTTA